MAGRPDHGNGIALWLMPEPQVGHRLGGIIHELADRYQGPRFEPHVTLVSGLAVSARDVLTRAGELAASTGPLSIEVEGVDHAPAYFRCLFLRVRLTAALAELHERARGLFGSPGPAPFAPHLSLLYASLDTGQRQAVAAKLGPMQMAFTADAIQVVSAEGRVEEWRALGTVLLGGAR